ncbi:nucleotide exchange factor GrpE [bacterium]|nr:nucleotide exchange factor GrpE [candidate division CSSED10-310 bacterium]
MDTNPARKRPHDMNNEADPSLSDDVQVPGEYVLDDGDLALGDDYIVSALAELESMPEEALQAPRRSPRFVSDEDIPEEAFEIVDDVEPKSVGVERKDESAVGVESDRELESLKRLVAVLEQRLSKRTEKYQGQINTLQSELKEKIGIIRKMQVQHAQLQKQYEEARSEGQKNRESWIEAVAEYKNLQRRSKVKMTEFVELEKAQVIREILPVFDNLMRSMEFAAPTDALVEGLRLIVKQCREILEGWDVRMIPAENQPFDPYCHEAVTRIPVDGCVANTIVEVLQTGYSIGKKVLRPAKVTVSYRPESSAAPEKSTLEQVCDKDPEIPVPLKPGEEDPSVDLKDGNLQLNSVESVENAPGSDSPGEDSSSC